MYFKTTISMTLYLFFVHYSLVFHGSARHMAVLCELLMEAQGPHSVLGELKRLVPAQS